MINAIRHTELCRVLSVVTWLGKLLQTKLCKVFMLLNISVWGFTLSWLPNLIPLCHPGQSCIKLVSLLLSFVEWDSPSTILCIFVIPKYVCMLLKVVFHSSYAVGCYCSFLLLVSHKFFEGVSMLGVWVYLECEDEWWLLTTSISHGCWQLPFPIHSHRYASMNNLN